MMRALKTIAALLLLANLAVYLWAVGNDDGPAHTDDAPAVNAEGMMLLREVRPPPAAPIVVESTEQPAPPPEVRCYRIGPFANPEDWAAAGRWMAAQRLEFRAVRSERRELRAIRVFLGPFASRAAAAPALRRLAQAGIESYPIAAAHGGAVLLSLGYFTQSARAAEFAADLRARGFAVDARDEYRSVGPFDWMEARLGPAGRKRLLARVWGDGGAQASEFDCAAAGGPGA